MYVVLTKDVKDLGYKGDVANVKRGYFVNFLYPNGLADFAVEKLVDKTAGERRERVLKAEELKNKAVEISKKLVSFVLEIKAKASEKGKLYGSVDEKAICKVLAEQAKIEVLPDQVKMKESLKKVGEYKVDLQLTDEIKVAIGVKVEAVEE